MKRLFIIGSLILPAAWLIIAWGAPHLDHSLAGPHFHFYIVTFFTFTALVVSFLLAVSLGSIATPRHQLLAIAFAVMGVLFFVHGVTTPNVLIKGFNPGIRWAAWLTLFLGGVIFFAASLDTPRRPLQLPHLKLFQGALALFCSGFILIVAFAPHWLAAVDGWSDPWDQQLAFGVSFLFWLTATLRLWLIWRQSGLAVDGVMALIAAWFTLGGFSLHLFPTWQVSWWIYHGQLLAGVITAVWALITAYEELRQFRLTYYYTALGLIVTGGLSLLAAFLMSQLVEHLLWSQLSVNMPDSAAAVMGSPDLSERLIKARRLGLLIAGLSLGSLFAVLLGIVHRADRLITRRTQELSRANADLQVAEGLRDDLTDMVVHDLRSPLTGITLNLNMLQKVFDDPQRRDSAVRFLNNSQAAAERMRLLVDQILDVARLEAGRLPLRCEPLSVADMLWAKAEFYAPQAEAQGKRILVEVVPDVPLVLADRELISRVIDNLIGNSLKFTDRNVGRVVMKARSHGAAVEMAIQDNGTGISERLVDQIFDKFYQVFDDSGRPVRQGSGLGLSFCRLAIAAHDGRIWVDSRPGEGSTFFFELPV